MDEIRQKIIAATAKIAKDLETVKCSVHSNSTEGHLTHRCRLCTAIFNIGVEVLGLEMETRIDQSAAEYALSRFPGETDDNLRERMKRMREAPILYVKSGDISAEKIEALKKSFNETIVTSSWKVPIFKADHYAFSYELPEGVSYVLGRAAPGAFYDHTKRLAEATAEADKEAQRLANEIHYALFSGKADLSAASTAVVPDPNATPPMRPNKINLDNLKTSEILKALEAGNYNAVPGVLHQGPCHDACPCTKKGVEETKCECGAAKTSGAKKGDAMHSSWCPWRKA